MKANDLTPPIALRCGCFGSHAFAGLDLSGYDPEVRAQDDLYRAVNGRWLDETEIPADRPRHGSFSQLNDRTDAQLRDLVDELVAVPQAPGSVADQVCAFYVAHRDTEAIDRAGLAPIRSLLAEIDGIQTPLQLAQWQGSMQGQLDTPVRLWVSADFEQPGVNRAITWQGGLGLPDCAYFLDTEDPRLAAARAAYVVYLRCLATLSGEPDPAAAAELVMQIEQRIAAVHWDRVENRDPARLFNPMTPAELMRDAPGFDWVAFLASAGLVRIDRLSVSQPSAVRGIGQLFAEVPLADWRCYFRLHCLDAAAECLPDAFREAHFAFHGTALTGVKTERPRWQQAVSEVNRAFGDGLGQLYVARHFSPAHKKKAQALVNTLLAAYRESIENLSWMTPATRARALEKLAKYTCKIGYPERWRDTRQLLVCADDALGNRQRAARFEWQRLAATAGQPVDRQEWAMPPQTVNAHYNPSFNEIVFPAAILQPPFFDIAADDALNYGAIGAVIGHEISHGFDDEGSRFDGDGVLRNWWSDADRAAFDALGARLVAQYEAYEPLPGRRLNGRLTLGENMADLSGLQIAFKAYRRAAADAAAHGNDAYSDAQRFFIGWAQVWRDKVRPERALQLLAIDPHAPAEFRANGAALNHDGFHATFATQPGDRMFKPPDERIRIW